MGLLQHPFLRALVAALLALTGSAAVLGLTVYLSGDPGSWGLAASDWWGNAVAQFAGVWLQQPPVLALWVALAGLLLLLVGALKRTFFRRALIATLLIPWLLMDIAWQRELGSNLAQLQATFGGRSTHERHLADDTGKLYHFVVRAKRRVFTARSATIHIAYDSTDRALEARKAAYFLLPFDARLVGFQFPFETLRNGDYLLWLGEPLVADQAVPGARCSGQPCQLNLLRADKAQGLQLFVVAAQATRQGGADGQ